MKYVIQLFSLLCFSMLTTISMAQADFDELFSKMEANGSGDTGGSTLSGGDRGGSGGGGDTLTIRLDWAADSGILPQDYTLNWTGPKEGVDGYTVQVIENDFRQTVVYVANVKNNSMTVPFGNLNLKADTDYAVRINSGDRHKSKKGVIRLVDKSVYNDAMKSVKSDARFQNGSRLDKIMMKAWALEHASLNMDAYQYYKKYMQTSGDDATLRNMKALFIRKHQ